MRELGTGAAEGHRVVGTEAARAGLDALFLLGPYADEVRAGAEAAGMALDAVVVAASHADLAARLAAYCQAGDLLLLKGSRGAAMEEVLRHLEGECRP
jgi:UDP-N-acetylmuramyl pentapeptide synthase